MDKRIAVCISGEMRNFDNPIIIDSYNKFVAIHNPDVFISTWNHNGYSMNHNYIDPNDNKITDNFILNSIKSNYPNIISVNVENYNIWLDSINPINKQQIFSNNYDYRTVNSYAQIYKICDSINLKSKYELENDFKYDIVIRIRPDSLFVNHFDLNIDSDTIYNINFGNAYYPNRIYDILFYGDSSSMDLLSKCFINYINLLHDQFHNGLCKRDACRLLYLQCIQSKLQVKTTDVRVCDIYRDQGFDEYYNLIKIWGEYNNQ